MHSYADIGVIMYNAVKYTALFYVHRQQINCSRYSLSIAMMTVTSGSTSIIAVMNIHRREIAACYTEYTVSAVIGQSEPPASDATAAAQQHNWPQATTHKIVPPFTAVNTFYSKCDKLSHTPLLQRRYSVIL